MSKSALFDRIEKDMIAAMKSKEELKLSTLRMLKSAVKYKQVELIRELSDEEVVEVLMKQTKQRRESIEGFLKGGRVEQAEQEKTELTILEAYLPEQMSEEELKQIVQETIKAVGAASVKDMGKVMGALNAKVKGKAEMGKVSALVKSLLG